MIAPNKLEEIEDLNRTPVGTWLYEFDCVCGNPICLTFLGQMREDGVIRLIASHRTRSSGTDRSKTLNRGVEWFGMSEVLSSVGGVLGYGCDFPWSSTVTDFLTSAE